jgi:hypothetical protein
METVKCQKSLKYFLTNYAYILNRNTGKRTKWLPWQYQLDFLDIIEHFDDVIGLKARQLGWTWLLSGYAAHRVRFGEACKGLLSSQGENEAKEFLAKSKFILDNLPVWMKLERKHPDSQEMIDFASSDSVLRILPATSKAGRSTDATFVIRDELATHPNAEDNYSAIRPTIDAGGKLIDLSTIDKMDSKSHFTDRCNRAMAYSIRRDLPSGLTIFYGGESGAVLVFGGWKLRPVREENLTVENWFETKVKPKYSPIALESEYPENIEDALRPAKTVSFFDQTALYDMLLSTKDPISQGEIDTFDGIVNVYKLPQTGEKYCIFTDPSDGFDDPFHTVVTTITGECVSEAHGKVPVDKVATIHDCLVREYNDAHNSYEVNNIGQRFMEILKNLGTPSQLPRRRPEGEIIPNKVGLYTSPQMKKNMLDTLEESIRRRLISVYRKDTIAEFQTLMRIEGLALPIVPKGKHDDAIMAWAGLCWELKYIPKVVGRTKTSTIRWS